MSSSRLLPIVSRQFSTSLRRSADEIHPGYKKLYAKMEHFQKPDGKPVFLKGGPFDGILYRFTVLLCGIAMVGNFATYYKLINK